LGYWQARQGIWRDELNDWRELQRYRDTFLVNMFIPEHGDQSTMSLPLIWWICGDHPPQMVAAFFRWRVAGTPETPLTSHRPAPFTPNREALTFSII
jgi:hypothetical protein